MREIGQKLPKCPELWLGRPVQMITLGWTRKALSPGAVKSHLIVHKKKIAQVRMATKIQSDQIQNLQQLDAVVAGPNDAKQLFVIDGQSHSDLDVSSQDNITLSNNEIFAALLGLGLKNEQFVWAIATALFTKTTVDYPGRAPAQPAATGAACKIVAVDADCDDESGQVEVRIEAQVTEAVQIRFEL